METVLLSQLKGPKLPQTIDPLYRDKTKNLKVVRQETDAASKYRTMSKVIKKLYGYDH